MSELDKIPAILYINLTHRKDRKKNIESQLKVVKYPMSKVIRINAIKNKDGARGCGLSHIKALKKAKAEGNKYTLILEDDFMWKSKNPITNINKTLKYIMKLDWDVCLLSCNGKVENISALHSKVIECQTTSSYIIHQKYINTLLKLWESSLNPDNSASKTCAIDQSWKKLQKKDNWISTKPLLGKQMPSYSDIEKKKVDYNV